MRMRSTFRPEVAGRTRAFALFAASGLLPLSAQQPLRALLPEACLAVVEVPAPVALYDDLLAAFTPVPAGLPDEVRATLSVYLLALPWLLGEAPRRLVDTLARGGAAIGVAPGDGKPRVFLILRPGDAAAAARWFGGHARSVSWQAHGEYVLVATREADSRSLAACVENATAGRFAKWPSHFCEDAAVRVFVDLEGLRSAFGRGQHLGENLDGGGRFLFGALAAALARARHATLALCTQDGLRFCAEIDHSTADTPFGALAQHGTRVRTMPSPPPGTLLAMSVDRSLHALFTGLDRFLTPEQKLGAQAFLSIADQVDGRSSFVDDLIGGLAEPIHGYVIEPPPAIPGDAQPRLLLPGFAFVAAIQGKDVETVLRRTAQVFTLIVNAERGQRNQRPFHIHSCAEGEWHGLSGELSEWRGPGAPPIEQALSPTLLFGQGHVCLASTREAALAVLGEVAAGRTQTLTGDRIELYGPALARTLARSREVLELARMLDEGESRSESHRFWSVLQVLAAEIACLRLALVPGDDRTALELSLRRQP
ncbi:MAG TPA: hypothetical protein VFD82_20800 [Planctomycetota bacterium]|nr:hypothetical protein [Planctomycetota bacterium]